jgi:hypothetical protein
MINFADVEREGQIKQSRTSDHHLRDHHRLVCVCGSLAVPDNLQSRVLRQGTSRGDSSLLKVKCNEKGDDGGKRNQ